MTGATPDSRRRRPLSPGAGTPSRRAAAARRLSERTVTIAAASVLALGAGWSLLADDLEIDVAAAAVVVAALSPLLLGMRCLLAVLTVAASGLGLVAVVGLGTGQQDGPSAAAVALIAVTALVGVAGAVRARRRDRLGLRRVSAETVLGMIQERAIMQAEMPVVPGWTVDIQHRPADGAVLSGDFVANRVVRDGDSQVLHLAVIDVAGCGITAGARALLLSGAVGGLLGSVPAEQFLTAVNDYLGRQQGPVGLASAVYLQLDLDTGAYRVRVAGHPPALHYRPAAPARWRLSSAAGTVLGVLPAVTGILDHDVLQPGESLFLYTDGVVEDRCAGLDAGTRRLMGSIEALAAGQRQGPGLAGLLIEQVPSTDADDRTLVMVRREFAAGRTVERREQERLLPVGS